MPPTYNIVIADTSCFILLEKIGELGLLQSLFGKIVTTSVIAGEFGAPLPEWIEIRDANATQLETTLEIGAGEFSAIILAIECAPALLIVDDDKARKVARKLGLNITGSLGIFLKAKQAGISYHLLHQLFKKYNKLILDIHGLSLMKFSNLPGNKLTPHSCYPDRA